MSAEPRKVAAHDRHNDGKLMCSFETEAHAVDYVVRLLTPYCKSIRREPEFSNGLRPDLGIRLAALPQIPLCVEVKKFVEGKISPLPEAIAQASTYADLTGYVTFIAPLAAKSVTRLEWSRCEIGSALLVAGQFNVGAIYFSPQDSRYGGMVLAGTCIAHFSVDPFGDPCTKLHAQAEHLLRAKQRAGSAAWRT